DMAPRRRGAAARQGAERRAHSPEEPGLLQRRAKGHDRRLGAHRDRVVPERSRARGHRKAGRRDGGQARGSARELTMGANDSADQKTQAAVVSPTGSALMSMLYPYGKEPPRLIAAINDTVTDCPAEGTLFGSYGQARAKSDELRK